MTTKRETLREWQKSYDAIGFSKTIIGDEALVSMQDDGKIQVMIRQMQSADTGRTFRLVFDTQTQCERLIVPILKGMTR